MKILISTSSFGLEDPAPLRLLNDAGIEFELNPYGRKLTEAESISLLKDKIGLVAGTETLNKHVLDHAPLLKVISRCGAGTDNVDLETAKSKNIAVLNTPFVHSDAVAELALAGMLSLLRHLAQTHGDISAGVWKKRMGRNLRYKRVGFIGFGKVAQRLATLIQPFQCPLFIYDPYVADEVIAEFKGSRVELLHLASVSDVLTLHLPYSKSVNHIVGREFFSNANPDLVIINTARGGLIDEAALCDFLLANPGAGAYLDTFEEEPYSGKLKELSNVILSPHVGTFTRETRVAMEVEAVKNLIYSLR